MDETVDKIIKNELNPDFMFKITSSIIKKDKEVFVKNKELISVNIKVNKKNEELRALQDRMQKLVEQFTHSLGNIIFPDTIYQVAEHLKQKPEYRKDVLLLQDAYHAENMIKRQGELLRQRYANIDPKQFQQTIRGCRVKANSIDVVKSIGDILDYAISRVTARFLNQHYANLNKIRDEILSNRNVELDKLKKKFEDDILLSNSETALEWTSKNLRPIKLVEMSPLWKKVFIQPESYSEALLFGYFSEIFFNAFKYADHQQVDFLELSFNESDIDGETYLSCSWLNQVAKEKILGLGTGQGLESIREDLKQLNETDEPEKSLLVCQQNGQFKITLFFNKELLLLESLSGNKLQDIADLF